MGASFVYISKFIYRAEKRDELDDAKRLYKFLFCIDSRWSTSVSLFSALFCMQLEHKLYPHSVDDTQWNFWFVINHDDLVFNSMNGKFSRIILNFIRWQVDIEFHSNSRNSLLGKKALHSRAFVVWILRERWENFIVKGFSFRFKFMTVQKKFSATRQQKNKV